MIPLWCGLQPLTRLALEFWLCNLICMAYVVLDIVFIGAGRNIGQKIATFIPFIIQHQ